MNYIKISYGFLKGRIFNIPKNCFIKITTSKAKIGLFNILNNYVIWENLNVLDLFCGSGNISYEFISRGVNKVDAVDINYNLIKNIFFISNKFKIKNKINLFCSDVFLFLKKNKKKYNIIFMDPPFNISFEELQKLLEKCLSFLFNNGFLIIENSIKNNNFIYKHNNYCMTRKYGKIYFNFLINKKKY